MGQEGFFFLQVVTTKPDWAGKVPSILAQSCQNVDLGSPETLSVLEDVIFEMYRTMYGTLGVGLAAPQVGIPWRLSVIDMQDGELVNDGKLILINPEIVETYAGETKPGTESCLSIPFYTAKVPRFQKIKVKNHRLDNTEEYIEAEDFFARVIQHEMDHLNGQVYLDRISNTDIQPEPGAHITSYARRAVSKLMVHDTIKEVLEGMA